MFRRLIPLLILVPLVPAALAHGAGDHGVTTSGNTFSPKTITVAVGDTVTWSNGGGSHSVHFDDESYDSGDPSPSDPIGSRSFPATGSFAYHCDQHGGSGGVGMSGTINVTTDGVPTPSPSPGPTPSPGPSATPTPSPGPPGSTPSPSPGPTASPPPSGGIASPVLDEIGFRHSVRRGRLRGHVTGQPEGAELVVTARRGSAPAGRFETTLAAGPTPVVLRLSRGVRRALKAGRHPRVTLKVTLTSGDETVFERRRARLRAG